ncbi:D-aspartate oxidase [Lingula anatina]|uniref:D-aspartate oxidase n=1 Tax=Lingula anatina TaxID=7574 RepID=A0A1S3J2U8_LINAN|nr:D-aspartate oxidase [Lingula anatina]|eukprot:XP_013404742.1 D-aspartate oxidase [Lingula anatina]
MAQIAVIGAGVVGLSTAVCVQERIPGAVVTIIAEKFSPNTTSDVAAGYFAPSTKYGVSVDRMRQWAQDSFKQYDLITRSEESADAGVILLSGYYLYHSKENIPEYMGEDVLYQCRDLTAKEMGMFPNYKFGRMVTIFVTECRRYLPWMMTRFKKNGGHVVQQKVASLEELAGRYDVVMNCCGLGARDLVAQHDVTPWRGQVVRVKAPWVKHMISTDDGVYIVPCVDSVVLGGVKEVGHTNLNVDEETKNRIIKRCLELMPSLKNAEFLYDGVGLRPHREPLRLELECVRFGEKALKVIHNYGHGPIGVSLSWGTAVEAVRLAQNALRSQQTSKL